VPPSAIGMITNWYSSAGLLAINRSAP
jgi:hypothetical protein